MSHHGRPLSARLSHSCRVEAHQITVAGAFQASIPQWPYHKSVGLPFVLIGTCSSKLFPMPHAMPLKIITVFKRHGVGNVPKLYISREMACRALACDGIESLSSLSQGGGQNCYSPGIRPAVWVWRGSAR